MTSLKASVAFLCLLLHCFCPSTGYVVSTELNCHFNTFASIKSMNFNKYFRKWRRILSHCIMTQLSGNSKSHSSVESHVINHVYSNSWVLLLVSSWPIHLQTVNTSLILLLWLISETEVNSYIFLPYSPLYDGHSRLKHWYSFILQIERETRKLPPANVFLDVLKSALTKVHCDCILIVWYFGRNVIQWILFNTIH